jgi:O-antigen/teichoic acid export membrane protein
MPKLRLSTRFFFLPLFHKSVPNLDIPRSVGRLSLWRFSAMRIPKTIAAMSQLKKSMAAGVVCSIVSALLMAISYPIFLRYLGYEQYGLWLVIGTVLSFAQLSNLGLGQAVSQQVAAKHSIGDHRAVDRCVSTAVCTLILTGGLACGGVALFRNGIAKSFHLSASNTALVSSLLPAVALLSLVAMALDTLNAALAGIGRIDLYLYLQLLSQVLSVGTTLTFLHSHHGIESFVFGNVVAYFTVHALSAIVRGRILGRSVFHVRHFSWLTLKTILGVSLYLMGTSVLVMLFLPFNKLILARFVGVSALPTFDIIMNGSLKIRSLLESGMRALMPEVSRLAALKDHENIARLTRKISQKLIIGGGLIFTVMLLLCGFAVRLWLRDLAIHFPLNGLRIILIGTFFSLLAVPPYYSLLGLGRSSLLFSAGLIQSGVPILSVCATVLLHRQLSLFGVLAWISVGMAISSIYLNWESSRVTKSLTRSPETVDSAA